MTKFLDFFKKDKNINSKNTKNTKNKKYPEKENKIKKSNSSKKPEIEEYLKKIGQDGWVQSMSDLPEDLVLLTFENIKGIKISPELKRNFAVCGILGTNEQSNSGNVIILNTKNIHETRLNNAVYDISSKLRDHGFDIKKTISAPEELLTVLYSKNEANKVKNDEQSEISQYKLKFLEYVTYALRNKVTDIHFEIRKNNASIRMRRLGEMYEYLSDIDPKMAEELIRCIYQAHTDETSRGIAFLKDVGQAASINIDKPIDGKKVRIRYQSNPAYPDGFDVILRLLPMDPNNNEYDDLLKLGYSESQKAEIEEIISKPRGALIIAGTTGSGKSTTLKNLLMYINQLHMYKKKVYTIEDPPEYYIPQVTQVPVNREKMEVIAKNFNDKEESPFAVPIANLMRSDPDIAMIGEIRDRKTAIGIQQLTQSGHQVLSTLHASSALDVVERLYSLGIDLNVLSDYDFLTGLIYQKLLPVVCPDCSKSLYSLIQSANSSTEELIKMSEKLKSIGFTDNELKNVKIRTVNNHTNDSDSEHEHSKYTCKTCNDSGLIGQEVCAEVIKPDIKLYSYFKNRDSFNAKVHWRSIGYYNKDKNNMTGRTILDHAVYKVKLGKICPFDVEKNLGPINESYNFLMQLATDGFFEREVSSNKLQNKIKKHNNINKLEKKIIFEQTE